MFRRYSCFVGLVSCSRLNASVFLALPSSLRMIFLPCSSFASPCLPLNPHIHTMHFLEDIQRETFSSPVSRHCRRQFLSLSTGKTSPCPRPPQRSRVHSGPPCVYGWISCDEKVGGIRGE